MTDRKLAAAAELLRLGLTDVSVQVSEDPDRGTLWRVLDAGQPVAEFWGGWHVGGRQLARKQAEAEAERIIASR